MDQICRLCLTVSENMAFKIGEETKILEKMSFLNIQIPVNKSLPNLVCNGCSKTIDDISIFRDNIVRNQNKLIEQLNKGTDLDDFYQSLIYKDFSKATIKTELETEDDDLDQSFYNDAETINDAKRNKTDQEDKVLTKFDKENDDCKPAKPMKKPKRYKNTLEKKKSIKLKNHNNDISTNITVFNRNKKRKISNTDRTKINTKTCKSKAEEKSPETKYKIEICTEVEKNISKENFTNSKPTNNENTVDSPTLVKNEIEQQIKDNKCLTCFEYLSSTSELIKHYRTIHNHVDKENGGTDFIKSNEIKTEKFETSLRPYNCKICGRTFTSIYAIVRHARAHSDYSLSCSHGCGYSTVYRGALKDHEKRHEKDFRYKCATCGAGFHVRTWHDQHQNIHKNVKPFVCDLCGMAFHMNRYLTSHRSSVHADSIQGVERFVCPHCDLAYNNARHFRTHLEEHRGKKKFLCALCGKECTSTEQLKYHNNSHLGLKPFSCSICNKGFAKKFNLTVHERAHAGEKHLCQQCGKHFAQRSTLLRHARKCHPESKECKNKSESIINK